MLLFLVTPCLVVAVSFAWSESQLKKKKEKKKKQLTPFDVSSDIILV